MAPDYLWQKDKKLTQISNANWACNNSLGFVAGLREGGQIRQVETNIKRHSGRNITVLQRQKAVAAYLKSKQLLPFGSARQISRAGEH